MSLIIQEIPKHPTVSFVGPKLHLGPLPALIYFALSKEESLGQDPFNQPVQFLQNHRIRVFSYTIPFHEHKKDHSHAMHLFKEEIKKNPDFLNHLISEYSNSIQSLIDEKIIDPKRIYVAGLSRGAFIATHLAAKNPLIQTILGFAPLTDLSVLNENETPFDYSPYNLSALKEKLYHKKIRFYIGNHDTRVHTDSCYQFLRNVTETAYLHRSRSPDIELMMTASVGHKGHGTLPHIFEDGIRWLVSQIEI